ncbi:hypothetical protein BOW52_10110 [Solemya elarraichensis gill symbiont]|uniref:Uncharacterized protein n=1 Tax=Solemya elarraichensis gill symbiont TaxID=1918949 RepID=A0A1T2KXZ6_9GAMM|nr:hypothetical protein BOW52_10110 [Solemya elarraichensis gill symbiont]
MNHKALLNHNKSVEPNSVQGMRRTATARAVASVLSDATIPQTAAAMGGYGSYDTFAIYHSGTYAYDDPDLHHVYAYFDDNISGSSGVDLTVPDRAHNNTITNDGGYSVNVSGSAVAIAARQGERIEGA